MILSRETISPKGSEKIWGASLIIVIEKILETLKKKRSSAYQCTGLILICNRVNTILPTPTHASQKHKSKPETSSFPPKSDNPSLIISVCAITAAKPDMNTAVFVAFIA
jgi:hypothetical protein